MPASKLRSPSRAAPTPPSSRRTESLYVFIFFLLFTVPLIAMHGSLLTLPYFWDEHGQFIPTALDLLRSGSWVAHSTLPNIHPPGVEAYLVLWYKIFGYSIAITRIAMLLVAGLGLLLLFLLSIELSRGAPGFAAFYPVAFLGLSPLFYTQSMMAQLDAPAMTLTLLSVLLFVKDRYRLSALACVALVLTKETGSVTPAVLFLVLIWQRRWRDAVSFLGAPVALGIWLFVLHSATGYWMGNPGFAHYNVGYSLQPVHVLVTIGRRIYYLFFAEFRWVGVAAILLAGKRLWAFRSSAWATIALVCAANLAIVTLLGGAALERYLLPVLPFFYIVVAIALVLLPRWQRIVGSTLLLAGLVINIFWNPPYPFPFENNYAMVDFVELQQAAAVYLEDHLSGARIATAWPYTSALENRDFGYVRQPLQVVDTKDFSAGSVRKLSRTSYDVLVVYTRTWAPTSSITTIPFIRSMLERYYEFKPQISEEQCSALGLWPLISWERRGQTITIYSAKGRLQ
jgi:4-amino-4-deoxy-L-arabinose transferase-like glycosyltransferase